MNAKLDHYFILVLSCLAATYDAESNAQKLSDVINTFGIDLLNEIMKDYNGNVLISPLSLAVAMNGLFRGSGDSTAAEIANVFNYSSTGLSRSEIQQTFKAILDYSKNNHFNFDADFADAFWIKKGVSILPDFTSDLKNYYSTEVNQVDFTKPSASNSINAWIDKETRGTIPSIYKVPLEKTTSVVVTSANYFKGKWALGFDSAQTKDEPFFVNNGSVNAKMMYVYGTFPYAEDIDTNAKYVEIPFDGGEMTMVILLPNDLNGILNFKSISLDKIKLALLEMNPIELHLRVPRFNISYAHNLQSILTEMGIKEVFSPGQADLSGIDGQKDLSLTQVVEARSIAIGEAGITRPKDPAPQKLTPIGYVPAKFDYFTVDHPFGFMIRHKKSGIIWYFGRVMTL